MNKISYKLEIFEGPLDLLLYLIKKNKLDIKDIQIRLLLEQYIIHIKNMEKLGIYIESEFLDMISRLIYIKTVSLLPKNEEEKLLKNELSDELLERQKLKGMLLSISSNINFDSFSRVPKKIVPEYQFSGKIDLNKFVNCYINLIRHSKIEILSKNDKLKAITSHKIIPVYVKAISILRKLKKLGSFKYSSLFTKNMSKSALVATFLAILELIKIHRMKIDNNYNCIRGKENGV